MALALDDAQAAQLLKLLGLPADTADIDVILATAKDLADQVAELDPEKPSTVAAAAKAAGLEVIDKDTAEALRRDAAEGRKMAADAAKQKIAATVDESIRRGRITPTRRDHWITLIGADPGMADVLAKIPDETAAPIAEAGHGSNPDPAAELTDAAEWFY
ncbi:hypothetical protein [Mycolicibacterium iranicum]|uniref:Mu-like prophage I protein n=1 Tax=Mycolicibacterium iranicum TaxID=912594 RepID=A0ABT4HRL3_MYCIR|nr:hypothetical protein [Mycolicibacterium iranicum]MCZ0732317.1 hypothetical protein [Mycolicibacterium iranicum]